MPPSLGSRTRRVTLILFEGDVALMERRYGRGWTEQVRRMVRDNCRNYLNYRKAMEDTNLIPWTEEDDNGN